MALNTSNPNNLWKYESHLGQNENLFNSLLPLIMWQQYLFCCWNFYSLKLRYKDIYPESKLFLTICFDVFGGIILWSMLPYRFNYAVEKCSKRVSIIWPSFTVKLITFWTKKKWSFKKCELLKEYISYEVFYDRKKKLWPSNTGYCLIQVTTYAGLAVITNYIRRVWTNELHLKNKEFRACNI